MKRDDIPPNPVTPEIIEAALAAAEAAYWKAAEVRSWIDAAVSAYNDTISKAKDRSRSTASLP